MISNILKLFFVILIIKFFGMELITLLAAIITILAIVLSLHKLTSE